MRGQIGWLLACKGKMASVFEENSMMGHQMSWPLQGDDYTLGNVEDLDPSEWQVRSDAFP